MQDIRDCLRLVVENGPYNKSAVARAAGLSPSKFSEIIKKNRKLDANEMLAFCKALGITPNQLIEAGSSDTGQHDAV